MSQFVLECVFNLPDNGHDAADVIALTKEPWRALLRALEENGVNYEEKAGPRDSAPKPASAGKKRGPRPKQERPASFIQQPLATTHAVAAE